MHAPCSASLANTSSDVRLSVVLERQAIVNLEHLAQVADYSLLLKWPGSNPSLKPAVFISHTDVVDVGDESAWTHPPFSGAVADGWAQQS